MDLAALEVRFEDCDFLGADMALRNNLVSMQHI